MSVKFACHHCGQRLSVNDEKVGQKAKCPKCRGPIAVPTQEAGAAQLAEIRASREDVEVEDVFAEFTVYDDEDSELIYEVDDEPQQESQAIADASLIAVPRWVLYAQGVLLGVVALMAFMLGIMVGGGTSSDEPGDGDADLGPVTVSGKLTYLSGNQKEDEGAFVIALPALERLGEKIHVDALDDGNPLEKHPSVLAIREHGGDVARVNIDGNYRLRLAEPGMYLVLMISQHTLAKGDGEPESVDLGMMGRYFIGARDLIMPHKYVWRNQKIDTDTRLDHDFGRSRE